MAIVERKVKPERERARAADNPQALLVAVFAEQHRPFCGYCAASECGLRSDRSQFLARWHSCLRTSLLARSIDRLCIFEHFAPFGVLQCRIHEAWARFFGSSLKDRLRYTPSDCFETFPFPAASRGECGVGGSGARSITSSALR